jgi:acetyl-CoA C-acetyltransferase
MFADSLNLDLNSNLTSTGGMAFAGGPLNHFVIQSTVKILKDIKKDSNKIGLVTGVSGMMTKQSYALWAKEPFINFVSKDVTNDAKKIEKPIPLSSLKEGSGKVLGYTVLPKNNVDHKKAVIYIEDINRARKVLISYDKKIIQKMGEEEWVGKLVNFKDNYLA